MIDGLLRFSIERRWIVMALVLMTAALGVHNYQRLPIDAVPDITNVQVQINAHAEGYSPLEVEQRVTAPIETALAGLPQLEYTRSLSRYGLSQVTAVFEDGADLYFVRSLVNERVQQAHSQLPDGVEAELGPVATGLGEIFLYTVRAAPDARRADGAPYDLTDLRTIQDWIIRPQLRRVAGVAEVNSIGGYERQFHVAPDPAKLVSYGLSLHDIAQAIARNNDNVGAGYIENNGEQLLIRAPGQLRSVEDIAGVLIAQRGGVSIAVRDVADVALGRELRTGAATRDGAETVLGTAVMRVGENSRTVAAAVAARLVEINRTLPTGVTAEAVYDRTKLVNRTIRTVQLNLLEGAVLVIAVLLWMLGSKRAALLTAAVIPLSMLLLITGMVESEISANLMSLGALDFGLIVDGALIIVENCVLRLAQAQHARGRLLDLCERFDTVFAAAREVFTPSLVSVLVVILVNLPILALSGAEGKMFRPMAFAVIVALLGALVLSLTFIPAALAISMKGEIRERENAFLRWSRRRYAPALDDALARPAVVLGAAGVLIAAAAVVALRMGSEFIPSLDEGDIAVQSLRAPGTSLTQSIDMQLRLERALLEAPEVHTVFGRVGTAEVATDPMPPNISDGLVMLKPRAEWPDPDATKKEVLRRIDQALDDQVGSAFEISQPIQLRFNELISGVRSALGVKIYGDDPEQLLALAEQAAATLRTLAGARDVQVEQVAGLPVLSIEANRAALARYGLNVADLQDALAAALRGEEAGVIFDADQRSPIIVRLSETMRANIATLERLPLTTQAGGYVPVGEVAKLELTSGPNQISRENGKRRIVVTANVADRDLSSFVADAQEAVAQHVTLPAGYWIEYGGTFEQLESAAARLRVLIPVTLLLIFGLLLVTFGSAKDALLVFSGVPLALTGGVFALWLRGLPLSITAGVGFITLCGVAVLTGVVMVAAIRAARERGAGVDDAIRDGALLRLRPIVTVGLVAALGFLPMALNAGAGAEVQRPLATVVIGGIVSSTLLTLFVLPVLYRLSERSSARAGESANAQ